MDSQYSRRGWQACKLDAYMSDTATGVGAVWLGWCNGTCVMCQTLQDIQHLEYNTRYPMNTSVTVPVDTLRRHPLSSA